MDAGQDDQNARQSPLSLPFNLTSRDRLAIAAYERDCVLASIEPTDQGHAAWVHEWRGLDEETRLDALDHQPYPQP